MLIENNNNLRKFISDGQLKRWFWNIFGIIWIRYSGEFFRSLLWLVINDSHLIWRNIWWTRTPWFWNSENFWIDTNAFSHRIHYSFCLLNIPMYVCAMKHLHNRSAHLMVNCWPHCGQFWTNCNLPKLRSITEALIKWFILLDKIETKDVKNERPKIIHILTKIR